MKRTRWTAAAAVGLACLLAAPAQAAVRRGADHATQPAVARQQAVKIVPLSADLQVSHAGSKARTTSHLHRDSQGRTRTEAGSVITITDPTTHTTLRLDARNHTYRRTTSKAPSQQPSGSAAQHQTLASQPHSLGTRKISGVRAEGRSYTVTVPAYRTRPALTKKVTIWLSNDVQLPVQTKVTDTTGQSYTQTYTNIRVGAEPAANLFTVPAGYREAGAVTTQDVTTQEACPLLNEPDPLVLESFGPFLGSGVINATTDPQIGCLFFADSWVFQYPLEGFRTVPLGLPFDQWYVYDNGGLLPFVPYVAFGDIAFAATNFSDVTIKDSFIVLTVFF